MKKTNKTFVLTGKLKTFVRHKGNGRMYPPEFMEKELERIRRKYREEKFAYLLDGCEFESGVVPHP